MLPPRIACSFPFRRRNSRAGRYGDYYHISQVPVVELEQHAESAGFLRGQTSSRRCHCVTFWARLAAGGGGARTVVTDSDAFVPLDLFILIDAFTYGETTMIERLLVWP
jgi:hypothetical protein